jgi:hypothetical protein
MAACNLLLKKGGEVATDKDKVCSQWAADKLKKARAPEGLLHHLDAGMSLRWMERCDLADRGLSGYIDYLMP